MIPRVATVLSAREWEPALVALARETASIRMVLRAYRPSDLTEVAGEIDVVVAGTEVSWVTARQVSSWTRKGLRVVGVYPDGDQPGREMLERAGAAAVLPDSLATTDLLDAIRFLHFDRTTPAGRSGILVTVAGPRGAPGRTEVAVALAYRWAKRRSTMLIDLDVEAPAVAVRLGTPPRPDITDAADAVRSNGDLTKDVLHRSGKLTIVTGSHRIGEPALRPALAEEVIEAALAKRDVVVVDLPPGIEGNEVYLKRADHAVLVADAGATGLVRAACMVGDWSGPPPALILNRVLPGTTADVVAACRKWTGLEPAALVPEHPRIRLAARRAGPPDRLLARHLRKMEPAA